MSRSEQLKAIDRNINEAKQLLERGDALKRLESNKDFLLLIKQGYFQDEAVRLVHLRGDPQMQTPEYQASILLQMDAIATLNQFFNAVRMSASFAEKSIEADEEAREEIAAEELNNG